MIVDEIVQVRRIEDFVGLTPGQKIALPEAGNREETYVGRGLESSCSPGCSGNMLLNCEITQQKKEQHRPDKSGVESTLFLNLLVPTPAKCRLA